ncbi:MAG: tRNA (adenosine(37)-N6)-threonylcarbamoyltransferase complex transferase subunit TsaD [Deltaproteobacteria bacterium]|nr:tRNA (adenosine(37)-N6)-threonylcarbamoyltransferase complex transferase subunit TsaD [Deltaproteobacteria bacterium]
MSSGLKNGKRSLGVSKTIRRAMLCKEINILAFESSCDDTSVALLRACEGDEFPKLISLSVQSQQEVHEKYGGVVPDLASRAHLRNLLPCLKKVLDESKINLSDVDLMASTHQPGLIGCLLIGHSAAKALSFLYDKPLLSCHHIEGHLMSVFLEHRPAYPLLAAVVSGGHTSLYLAKNHDDFEKLGVTLDDAIGEAFDKGAKVLGLPFPGGPEIDRLAKEGNPTRYKFGKVQTKNLDFSFSGHKSELVRLVQREGENLHHADAAASYQKALIDHLMDKIEIAIKSHSVRDLAIVGGVARNSELRLRLEELKNKNSISQWYAPSAQFCTDNAAMIGVLAYRKYLRKEFSNLSEDVHSTFRPNSKKKKIA